MQHGDMLALSEEQQAQLKAWRMEHNDKTQTLAQQVTASEQKLLEMALGDAEAETLQQQYAEIAGLRQQLAATKIACRSNLQSVLDAEQFQQVLALYKDEFAAGHGQAGHRLQAVNPSNSVVSVAGGRGMMQGGKGCMAKPVSSATCLIFGKNIFAERLGKCS
ncbi:MAG: hypothetical protein R3E95_19970 [Thiolinea sp.]